ncbi:conserved exported hypothetical protein [Alphaproteobacteria bacterium]
MLQIKYSLLAVSLLFITSCSTIKASTEHTYPKSVSEVRNDRLGKVFGKELTFGVGAGGLVSKGQVLDFDKAATAAAQNVAVAAPPTVNGYMWHAAIDALSFMPLHTVDPVSGIIITDWYQVSLKKHERYKITAIVTGTGFRADAVSVKVFKEVKDGKENWHAVDVAENMGLDIENKIVEGARMLKFQKEVKK